MGLLTKFAEYNYNTNYDYSTGVQTSDGIPAVMWVLYIAFIVFMIAAMWRVFTKASKPGWAAIVPIYNTYVLLKIVGRPGWWLLLYFIPLVNLIVAIIVLNDVAKAFSKGVGYTLLLIFLPFIGWPMLAWGDAKYTKPKGA